MTDTSLGTNRLLQLAAFLETIPHTAFQMESWLSGSLAADRVEDMFTGTGTGYQLKPVPADQMQECGFAACALGWACTIPEFHEAGLTLTVEPQRWHMPTPEFNGNQGYDAASAFFNIDREVAINLFHPDAYGQYPPGPSTVAARLRYTAGQQATH